MGKGGNENRTKRIVKVVLQKYSEEIEEQMRRFYGNLSEKEKRSYAALEAEKLGYGGQKYICGLLGCSPTTLRVGRRRILAWIISNPKG